MVLKFENTKAIAKARELFAQKDIENAKNDKAIALKIRRSSSRQVNQKEFKLIMLAIAH